MYSLIRLVLVVMVVSSCSGKPAPGPVQPPPPAQGPFERPPRPPGVPGPVDLHLTCKAPKGCSHPPGEINQNPDFTMDIAGDQFDCRNVRGTLTLVITNSQDSTDRIRLSLVGFTGAGHYALDRVLAKSIDFATTVHKQNCHNGALENTFTDLGAQAGSPDTCGAQGCTLDVADPSPNAPYPKPLQFQLNCPNACQNGSTYSCTSSGGSIQFTVRSSCEGVGV
jgi:hypothetical protein